MMSSRSAPLARGKLALFAGCLALLFAAAPVRAGEFVAVEVGSSGEILPNSALHQPKHYLKQDEDLLGRIACLLQDVDSLLAGLHAQPAQLAHSAMVEYPADGELGALFALALDHSPELAPMKSELAVLAARTRLQGAKPDPMLGLELDDLNSPRPLLKQVGDTRVRVMLSQEFESYGKRGLRREIAHQDELQLELQLKQEELDLLLEVTEAYYDIAGSRARLRSLDQNIKLMGVLIELANRKYSVGLTPLAAVMAAQVEQAEMEAMRIELINLIAQQEVMLEGLLGRPGGFKAAELKFDSPYPLPLAVEWDNQELMAQMLECRPDYQLLNAKLEQQELQLELAEREYRPNYKLSAEYSVSPLGQDSLMAAVEIPLFTHKEERQDSMVQEAYAMQAVTEDERTALENKLLSDLQTFQYELRMHAELVELYSKGLVPQSRLALDSNIAAYSANMMDLSDLIMSQQTLLAQEQALEENYIHILHTLTDLQVVTCVTFDPEPFLHPAESDADGQTAVDPLDLANQALAEASQVQEGLEGTAEFDAPLREGGFIDRLRLPQRAGESPPQAPDPKEAAPGDKTAPQPEGDFYQPFVPGAEPEEEGTEEDQAPAGKDHAGETSNDEPSGSGGTSPVEPTAEEMQRND